MSHEVNMMLRMQNNTPIQSGEGAIIKAELIKSRRASAHHIPLCFYAGGVLTTEQLAQRIYGSDVNEELVEKLRESHKNFYEAFSAMKGKVR